MLKPYNEMRKIDVLPFCEVKKGKDDEGKVIDIPYLNWAKCVDLLHENGAEKADLIPRKAESGSYLFESREVSNKDGRKTGCYFVSVKIVIDDQEYFMDAPLMNGNLVVYDDTLNQLRIANAHARAFVKGVAIYTGLGFDLWVKHGDDDTSAPSDDLSIHSISAIKKRVEELITIKLQNGMTQKDLLSGLGLNQRQFDDLMKSFGRIAGFEKALKKL